MARVKRKSQARYPQIVKEHGLQEPWNSGRLEVVQEQDEENPKKTVERLRVKAVYDEMLSRGTITKEQRDCAEKYAILFEKAEGAAQGLYARVSLLHSNHNRWEPKYSQLEAIEMIRNIEAEVGKYHTIILRMIIIFNMNASKIAPVIGRNNDFVMGQIMSTFIRLEEAIENI
ncbi:hypothetical protein [Commensalibacter nepenthis]|uniref:Uncharacterized protein n=1 Tax=Commensalibacter nepenthis TaxID=3043872 RepID=A0ABT6Q8E6_9PROT|nr:hypothetical protein [Commensalibacter sp. TBRC 10068]MDI2113056.1 hypothetical protein [Commensalibacter sp. TBRC 10068]